MVAGGEVDRVKTRLGVDKARIYNYLVTTVFGPGPMGDEVLALPSSSRGT